MITTVAICATAVLAVLVLLMVARGEATEVNSGDELLAALQPFDLESFRTLTNPDEEEYLRNALDATAFRKVQRLRLLAATEYVRRIAHNAAVLMRLSQSAREHNKPEVVRASQELADAALSLRINCLLALARLRVRRWFPQWEMRLSGTLDIYTRAREGTVHLSRLRMPAMTSRIEAAM